MKKPLHIKFLVLTVTLCLFKIAPASAQININCFAADAIYFPSTVSYAQAITDTTSILKKCLDHPDIQQYFTKSGDGTNKQVYIMQGPVKFSQSNFISKFNKPVLIKSRREVYTENADDFFIFRSFTIEGGDNATATFSFNYHYKTPHPGMVELTLSLHKTNSNWEIMNTQTRRLL